MNKILEKFISNPDLEFEARIGKNATKINYNNVIQWLLMAGFKIEAPSGTDLLRIQDSDTRIELTGIGPIQYYCRTQQFINPLIIKKERVDEFFIDNYWTKLSLSRETPVEHSENGKKTFRLMNRVRLVSDEHPFVYDCSIVRMSNSLESLFNTLPTYEIESEFLKGTKIVHIQQAITFALRGFQRSNYPIGLKEMNEVKENYAKMTKTENFIGPRSITLQEEHMVGEDSIYDDFCVTEKADGERKMLFTTRNRMYYILSQGGKLGVEFTGNTVDEDVQDCLLDGEHVTKNKNGTSINSYVAFDIYYYNNKDVRSLPLFTFKLIAEYNRIRAELEGTKNKKLESQLKDLKENIQQSRNVYMKKFIGKLQNLVNIIALKDFMPCNHKNCSVILDKIQNGEFEYHTDGLIFTPNSYGVGMTRTDKTLHNTERTWELSFKWKPAEENTIDFLVEFEDKDLVKPGEVMTITYKKVNLSVGFSYADITANPSYSIFHGFEVTPPTIRTILFKPVDPLKTAHLSNITSTNGKIYTLKNEIIESGMIVEFRYDMTKPDHENWIPLRVRWDKMVSRRPNAFTTAINNWRTIHHPITEKMLTEPVEIKKSYYIEKDASEERSGLRKFHNKVKRELLNIIKENDLVIDFAIGLGGDLFKFKKASFVLGIDIDEANIMGNKDGVCKRYLNMWKERKLKTRGLFVQGNSSFAIKNGEGIIREYDKAVVRSVFGLDPKRAIAKGVDHHYGVAKNGFNVSSMQFAVHYMFKNITTLTQFIQNVADCTAINGYFVGTCYDGQTVFEKLKGVPYIEFTSNEKPLCKITKGYKHETAYMNETCLGYSISVLQHEIGVEHEEWLVFFPYFEAIMNDYGFTVVEIKKFETLYGEMPEPMTDGEKELSFLNKTFVFQKVRQVVAPVKLQMIRI